MVMMRKPIQISSVLFGGPVRNVATVIEAEIDNLYHALSGFSAIFCHIVESDSQDDTLIVLQRLAQKYPNLSYESKGNLVESGLIRTERIAYCRNALRTHLTKSSYAEQIDYMIMADLDGMNHLVTKHKIAQCWDVAEDWDVLTANQEGPYYDTWTIRHPDWCPTDCWQQKARLEKLFNSDAAMNLAVNARQAVLRSNIGLLEVDSAFGGLAIYKKHVFLDGQYAGVGEDGLEICDHVPFHATLRKKGYQIFINSALTNCYTHPGELNPHNTLSWHFRLMRSVLLAVLGEKRLKKYLERLQP